MFDTHCHLQDERIAGSVDDILCRAGRAGVRRLLCCGSAEEDWAGVARIGAKYGGNADLCNSAVSVSCAFGVHPWYVDQAGDNWDTELEGYLNRDPSAAVGEIGLDNTVSPRNDVRQIDIFTRQLEIAGRFGRPVSIHCRKAWGSLLSILKNMGGLRCGGAIHSYSGPPDLVCELEKLGCCISFSGSILIPGSKRAAESLKKVSPGKLLVETDSPDILPPGVPGPFNEPANIFTIINKAAEILAKTPEEVALLTYNNGLRLLNRK
ncbi:MAG: TatD family hydrolase [Chitinispirillales bacterium]|jgi:TatD DNase family protein|nr:TatD family hydrolase [Chitinispirillales bacterium]